jgi:hypothetical protein
MMHPIQRIHGYARGATQSLDSLPESLYPGLNVGGHSLAS